MRQIDQRHQQGHVPIGATSGRRTILPKQETFEIFDLEVANDRRRMSDCHSVRWHVFGQDGTSGDECRGMETDAMDSRSVQVICYHRASGMPCATFRIVLCNAEDPLAKFPIEEKTDLTSVSGRLFRHMPTRRFGIAEISRFCILKEFRRGGVEEGAPPAGIDPRVWASEERHRLGLAGLLWLGAAEIACHLHVEQLYALMETRLARLAEITGVLFEQLGPEVPRPGAMRAPYVAGQSSLRSLLAKANGMDVAKRLCEDIAGQLSKNPILHRHGYAGTMPQVASC